MRVGIPVQYLGDVIGVKADYLYLLEDIGATPVILYPRDWENSFSRIGGLLLPGGTDVDSKRYSPLIPRWWCYPPDSLLEEFDTKILPKFIGSNFPIFGICRGLQTLNVHFGGTLVRNIKDHPTSKEKWETVHEVTGKVSGWVNSFHHQAISKLGNGLEILAQAKNSWVIEAIKHQIFPIYAVQWHPERQKDFWSRNIMKEIFK